MGREVALRGSARRLTSWQALMLAVVAGGVLVCQGAAAAQPLRAATTSAALPSAHDLAVGESLLHYCAHVDPKLALRMRIRLDGMERGASRGQLEQLRATPEYRKAYEAVTQFTQKVDPHNARRMCGEGFREPVAHGKVSQAHHEGG